MAPVAAAEQDQPFGDGWAGARVAFGLTRPAGKTRLEVTGEVPGSAERVVVTPGATFQPSQVMGGADTRRLSVRGVAVAYR